MVWWTFRSTSASGAPSPAASDSPQRVCSAGAWVAAAGVTAASGAAKERVRPPPSPPGVCWGRRGAYCTIDIDRTKALSTTAKQQSQRTLDPVGAAAASDSPVGVRKTRHNSTLQELTGIALSTAAFGKRNSIID